MECVQTFHWWCTSIYFCYRFVVLHFLFLLVYHWLVRWLSQESGSHKHHLWVSQCNYSGIHDINWASAALLSNRDTSPRPRVIKMIINPITFWKLNLSDSPEKQEKHFFFFNGVNVICNCSTNWCSMGTANESQR